MSKDPCKKCEYTSRRKSAAIKLREAAEKERKESEDLVILALENHGQMSIAQLVGKTHLAKSTVQSTINRLRQDGEIKLSGQRGRVGNRGVLSSLYEIGVDDIVAMKRETIQIIFRDPLVEALYGPYQRETQ